MEQRGAGGTPGGLSEFFTGLIMMCIGGYLLLDNIIVSNGFAMSRSLFGWSIGTYGVPAGSLLLPLCFGVVLIFRKANSSLGWILSLGSLAALVASVLMSTHISLRPMSLWMLLTMLVLLFGGLGLFLKSLRSH